MTAPSVSGSGTSADKIREMGVNTETPSPPSCDPSPVDLRPFKDLPPSWLEIAPNPSLQDPSLVQGYEKLDRYFQMDDQKSGSGHGDRILHAEEIEAYKVVRGLRYGENTCSLMKEARQFSKSAEDFKKKISSLAKIEYGVFKFCSGSSENAATCTLISLYSILGLLEVSSLISRKKDKGTPPSGSGGTPTKDESSKSSSQEATKTHTTPVAIRSVETDLVSQIHQMYGGALYGGLSSTTLYSLSSHGKAPTLGIIPLVTPLPLTLSQARPLPVLRPVPVPVAP